MTTRAILQIGYCQFLLSAAEAQKVFELLDGRAVNYEYISEQEAIDYETTRGEMLAPTDARMNCNLLSNKQYEDGLDRAQAKARYEMRRELEQEEEARNKTQAA